MFTEIRRVLVSNSEPAFFVQGDSDDIGVPWLDACNIVVVVLVPQILPGLGRTSTRSQTGSLHATVSWWLSARTPPTWEPTEIKAYSLWMKKTRNCDSNPIFVWGDLLLIKKVQYNRMKQESRNCDSKPAFCLRRDYVRIMTHTLIHNWIRPMAN